MKNHFLVAKQQIRFIQAKRCLPLLLGFSFILFVGLTLFFRNPEAIVRGTGETIFLPLISKPTLYTISNEGIQWRQDSAPYPLAYAQSVTVNIANQEFMYVIGGGDIDKQTGQVGQSQRVIYTTINEDGTLGTWSQPGDLPDLPLELHGTTATVVGNLIYVLGGLNFPGGSDPFPNYNNTAFCAALNEDGSFLSWKEQVNDWGEELDAWREGVAYHTTLLLGDRLYLIGGYRRSAYFNQPWVDTKVVLSAYVGSISNCQDLKWRRESDDGELPLPLMNHTAVPVEISNLDQTDRYIYVMGGLSNKIPQPNVYRARIQEGTEGNIISWTELGPFAENDVGLQLVTAVHTGDYLYAIGGTTAAQPYTISPQSEVYRAKILSLDGALSSWENVGGFTQRLHGHATVVSRWGRIYVMGGAGLKQGEPVVYDTIFWTPLVFFYKSSEPENAVYTGDRITYNLRVVSNNVRDLTKLTVYDTLPVELQTVSLNVFTQTGRLLMVEIPQLPIYHESRLTFTAEVLTDPKIPGDDGDPGIEITPPPIIATQSLIEAITVEPAPTDMIEMHRTVEPGKGCQLPDSSPTSGTPRPKPTCTPTPAGTAPSPTPVETLTGSPTSTPSPTSSNTPTATPQPEPIMVINQASLCFEGGCQRVFGITAPFRFYLPLTLR